MARASELQACDLLIGIGEILRPRQEAANRFAAALRGGIKAEPPFTAFLPPMLDEAPPAPHDAARRRSIEQKEVRQKNAARATFLDSAQLALHCIRYIIAGEGGRSLAEAGWSGGRVNTSGVHQGAFENAEYGKSAQA